MNPTTNTERVVVRPQELTDFRPITLQVVESTDGSGKVRVRGEFARCDSATMNGRVYSRSLFEREVGRMAKDLGARKVFGELDHPTDGRTLLTRVSHVITGLEVQEDGTVIGEADILDTSRGQDLKALLKSGCSVGVSSRGTGSTRTLKDGKEEVQEDYRLMTFDFVAEPADQTAYPKTFFESFSGVVPEGMTADQAIQEMRETTAAKVESQLRQEFAAKLPILFEKLKANLRAEVEAELLADPSTAGAKLALEQVKAALRPFVLPADVETVLAERDSELVRLRNAMASRDLKIRELEDDGTKLESLARVTGFKYFVERALRGDEDTEVILAALGDMSEYTSLDALKGRLESVQTELAAKKQQAVEEAAVKAADRAAKDEAARKVLEQAEAEKASLRQQLEAAKAEVTAAHTKSLTEAREQEAVVSQQLVEEREARKASESALSDRVDDLQEALAKAVAANKIQALNSHLERKIAGHPQSSEIRIALNDTITEDTTRAELDEAIESFPVSVVNEDADNVRSRVRRLTRGGRQPGATIEEQKGTPMTKGGDGDDSDYLGLGADVGTIRKLSGLSR